MAKKTFILNKKHTGKDNYYDNSNCPIACALKDAGYTNVEVGGLTIDYTTPKGKTYRNHILDRVVAEKALSHWSKIEYGVDIEFTMDIK